MKTTRLACYTLICMALTFTSCVKDEILNATDTNTVVASATINLVNDLDFKTSIQASADNSLSKSTASNSVAACATITVDNTTPNVFPKTITVDFGTGCTTNNILRKGKLKITLTGAVSTPQSKMTIVRENYYVNGVKVEGTIVYVNETTTASIPQWTRTITNGRITTLLGDVYENTGTHTIKQTEGVSTPLILSDNTYEMTQGTHTITKVGGGTLSLTVLETLVKKFDCDYVSKGKLTVKGNLLNGTIDYGNGDCDKQFKYTHENGLVFNLDI